MKCTSKASLSRFNANRILYFDEGIVQASYIKCVIFVYSEAVKVNMSVVVYYSRNVKFNIIKVMDSQFTVGITRLGIINAINLSPREIREVPSFIQVNLNPILATLKAVS